MQPEPADHRLRPTSTVKGQCESIVPLHFQVFSAASSPRRTALSFFSLFHFRPIIRRPSRPRPRPPNARTQTRAASSGPYIHPCAWTTKRHASQRESAPFLQFSFGITADSLRTCLRSSFSSVQFWDYCRFAQNLPAVFTLKPCSDAQTASSTRERNLSFLSVCLT